MAPHRSLPLPLRCGGAGLPVRLRPNRSESQHQCKGTDGNVNSGLSEVAGGHADRLLKKGRKRQLQEQKESAVIVAGHSISCIAIKKLAASMDRLYNGTLPTRACGARIVSVSRGAYHLLRESE